MASFNPTQTRTVDPFASYNSDTVNALTKMITNGDNALFSPRAMDVTFDSTSPNRYLIVSTGIAFIDDVLIEITANHTVDFDNSTHYFGGAIIKEPGNYYIVLEYQFLKSRPAPEAAVKILTPTEVSGGSFGAQHILLKVAQATTGPWSINTLLDYNPSIPTDQRINTSLYMSIENTLPTFTQSRDWGRTIYVRDEDAVYFGLENAWENMSEAGKRITIDTTSSAGTVVYFDSNAEGQPATLASGAEGVITESGVNGRAVIMGLVNTSVQSAITISAGEIVYLSSSEPGTITNVATNIIVGKAMASGSGTVEILFHPRETLDATVLKVRDVITATVDWTLSGSDYYYDVDISSLLLSNKEVSVTCYNNADDKVIDPLDVEAISTSAVRIWMPVNTVSLNVIVLG